MCAYASHLRELHVIVLGARTAYESPLRVGEHVYVYPTHARFRPLALLEGLRIGRRLVREHRIDIISTQDPFECACLGYLLRRTSGAALQIQEHGDFFSQPYWRRERLLHALRYRVGLWLTRRADCLRVVSERTKRFFVAHGFPAERIAVVPVRTDSAAFLHAAPDPLIAVRRPPGGVLVLTMARFVPQKNLSLLVRAFARVVRSGVRAHLVVVGGGPEYGALLSSVEAAFGAGGDVPVSFLGWTEDPAGALKTADVYALSSDYEGWGRVCIEALAAGTPLLMTDVGCAGEVVHHEVNGLVVPVRDEEAFAAALARLCSDASLRERLATAGRATVAALPDGREHGERYAQSIACCSRCP